MEVATRIAELRQLLRDNPPRLMKVCQAAAPMAILLPMARQFADEEGIDSKTHGMTLRPFAFKGTSEGARKAWESRQRSKHPAPAAEAPAAPAPAKPVVDTGALDARMAELHAGIAPAMNRLAAIDEELNKDAFYRKSDYYQSSVHAEQKKLRESIAGQVAELNDQAENRMDAAYEDLPPVDYDEARWKDADTGKDAPIDHPEHGEAGIKARYDEKVAEFEKKAGVKVADRPDLQDRLMKEARSEVEHYGFGSPKFQKARDRWVVADTPTLELNAGLRGEIPMTAGLKRRASEAKNILTAGTLTADTKLSRTMELPPAVAASLKPGAVFESKGYMATQAGGASSYDRSTEAPGTIHTVATILAPKGTHAGDVDYGETILRPGRLRVVDAKWDGKTHQVTMEYLDEL